MKMIEYAGRNCYRTHDKITDYSYDGFIRRLIARGHEAPLEFGNMTVELYTSRAVLAEITRHRLASYCVESQRYVKENKDGDVHFIKPEWFDLKEERTKIWSKQMQSAEDQYNELLDKECNAQEAREVLPNSTACTIVMSANLREWRTIFKLRADRAAYPQMRSLMIMLFEKAHEMYPCVFDDIAEEIMHE